MEDDIDESFHDDWWDSLAIDQVTESQLQAAENAVPSSSSQALPASLPISVSELQAQLHEVCMCSTDHEASSTI